MHLFLSVLCPEWGFKNKNILRDCNLSHCVSPFLCQHSLSLFPCDAQPMTYPTVPSFTVKLNDPHRKHMLSFNGEKLRRVEKDKTCSKTSSRCAIWQYFLTIEEIILIAIVVVSLVTCTLYDAESNLGLFNLQHYNLHLHYTSWWYEHDMNPVLLTEPN